MSENNDIEVGEEAAEQRPSRGDQGVTRVMPRATAQISFSAINLEKYAILQSKVYTGSRATIFATKNGTRAYLLIEAPERGITVADVIGLCKAARIAIREGMEDDISNYITSGSKVDGVRGSLLIAEGKEPEHGIDSRVEWHVPEPGDFGAGKLNDQGQMDYRERRTYTFVEKDTHILTVHPPTKGVPGNDIRGGVLPATDGQWKRPLAGKHVRTDQQQRDMYADIDGVVQYDGQRVSMSKLLSVDNVDFNSGNIAYDGDVQVQGSVKEGFSVLSQSGTVMINGEVSASMVRGHSVFVGGRVTSSEIIASSQVNLHLAENSKIRCDGDINLGSDCTRLTVDCGGRLRALRSKLVGGRFNTLGGLECKWLGGSDGSGTQVNIQLETCLLPATDEQRAAKERVLADMAKLEAALGPIRQNPEAALKNIAEPRKTAIRKLLSKLDSLDFEKSVAESGLKKALQVFEAKMRPGVFVNDGISEGVKITIGTVSWSCTENRQGCFKIGLNHIGDAIVIEPATRVTPIAEAKVELKQD